MSNRKYEVYNKDTKKQNNSRKSVNRNGKQLKIMLGALGALVVGLVAIGVIIYGQLTNDDYTSLFSDTTAAANFGNAVDGKTQDVTINYNDKTYKKNSNIVNIVFLGIDSDEERVQQRMGWRSDMMMVCAVDASAKKATLISIPRDTWTDIYQIDGKTGTVTGTEQNRLNAAYARGGGPNKFGAANAKACIQNFLERKVQLDTPLDFTLDIPIPFFASIDMDGISKIADAVGGIEITLDTTIPEVGTEGETLTLKGQKAEDYLRDRHHSSGADFGRTAHQRDFMIQLAKKINSMGAVDALTKLFNDFKTYGKTDLDLDQALAFAKILNGIDIDSIELLTVPGVGKDNVVYHDEAATLDLLLKVYYNEVQ